MVLVLGGALTYPDAQNIPVYEDIANMSPKFISGIYAHIMPLATLASCDTKK